MDERAIEYAARFQTDGKPVSCEPFGNGHINRTFFVTDISGSRYVLQKINKTVFTDPEGLMRNVLAVTAHLREKAERPDETMEFLPTRLGAPFITDGGGEYWRMYRYIDGVCHEKADAGILRESGVAFGRFQRRLADFPACELCEIIPRFHDTPARYAAFRAALDADAPGRAKGAVREIAFALEREAYASLLTGLQASGKLPLRVAHNDTKLNNVLFDKKTGKALCVIDLDTVMPGLSATDFGDAVRFGASTGAEDERDLSKVNFSLPLFLAYADGFLSESGLVPAEREVLRDGAKMMALEQGVRFLTDYLSGDRYYKTSRAGHNLDRCRTQFKLVADMERQWDEMRISFEKGSVSGS